MLLLSTMAQALDSCESLALRTTHHSCEKPSTPTQAAPSVCLICASAHSPSLVSAVVAISTLAHVSDVSRATGRSFHAAPRMFALQVRPPPSL